MADQLCTTAQVKTQIGDTDAVDDAFISTLIDSVSDWVQDYTHRKLVPVSSTTYTFDTVSGYVLHVPIGILTVTLFEVATLSHQPETGGTYTTVAATDYGLRPKVQDNSIGWPFTQIQLNRAAVGAVKTFGNIENGARITGTFGFAATPPAVNAVAIDAVVAAYTNRQQGASGVIGVEAFAVPPWSAFFGRGSPQRGTLDRFRYQSL